MQATPYLPIRATQAPPNRDHLIHDSPPGLRPSSCIAPATMQQHDTGRTIHPRALAPSSAPAHPPTPPAQPPIPREALLTLPPRRRHSTYELIWMRATTPPSLKSHHDHRQKPRTNNSPVPHDQHNRVTVHGAPPPPPVSAPAARRSRTTEQPTQHPPHTRTTTHTQHTHTRTQSDYCETSLGCGRYGSRLAALSGPNITSPHPIQRQQARPHSLPRAKRTHVLQATHTATTSATAPRSDRANAPHQKPPPPSSSWPTRPLTQ